MDNFNPHWGPIEGPLESLRLLQHKLFRALRTRPGAQDARDQAGLLSSYRASVCPHPSGATRPPAAGAAELYPGSGSAVRTSQHSVFALATGARHAGTVSKGHAGHARPSREVSRCNSDHPAPVPFTTALEGLTPLEGLVEGRRLRHSAACRLGAIQPTLGSHGSQVTRGMIYFFIFLPTGVRSGRGIHLTPWGIERDIRMATPVR